MHSYSATDNRVRAYGAIAVVAVLVAMGVAALAEEVDIAPAWLLSAPTLGATFALVYEAMNRWGWRAGVVRGIGLCSTPNLNGTYEGELIAPAFNSKRPVKITITQTWQEVAVEFSILAPESSTSYSRTAEITRHGNGGGRIVYTYTNRIRPGIADEDMTDHDGTAELTISTDGAATGRYYNFRGRRGTLTLSRQIT